MRIKQEDMLNINGTRATVDLASSANLKPVWIGHAAMAGFQLVFTGTPAGNFKVQVSADPGQSNAASESQQYTGVSNWSDLTSPVTVSAAGTLAINVPDPSFLWARVVWTATGAGTTPVLTVASACTKGV